MGMRFTRRDLVRAGAAAGTFAALGICAPTSLVETGKAFAESDVERVKHHTCCHGCYNTCPVWVYTEDGVAVKIVGDKDGTFSKGAVCTKCVNQLHTVYSPRHVLHPMKRVGERGTNEWEAIGWDEAIDIAADQIATTIRKYGMYSLSFGGGGGGMHNLFVQRAVTDALGTPAHFAPGSLQCYMPAEMCGQWMTGGENNRMEGNHAQEMWNEFSPECECQVMWGAQPTAMGTAYAGRATTDARVRGVKTIVIDPYLTNDAAKADIWLAVRPYSDTALMLCWFRYVIDNELYDQEFAKYWTNYPFLINPQTRLPWRAEEVWPDYVNPAADPNDVYDTPAYVCFDARTNSIQPFPFSLPEDSPVDPVVFCEADVNGVTCKTAGQIQWEEAEPWTLEATAECCWVDADKIEEAIRLYATTKSGIATGVFSDMSEIASHIAIGSHALDMLMGKVNRPGSNLSEKGAASHWTTRPTLFPNKQPYQTRFGVGWTIGLTENENRRRVQAAIDAWNEQGKDGEQIQRRFAEFEMSRPGTDRYRPGHHWRTCPIRPMREQILTDEPFKVNVHYEYSGTKYAMMAEGDAWKKAYNNLDFVIQQYPNMTANTIEDVDLFLPTEEWLEMESATESTAMANQRWIRKPIVHLGETVNNHIPIAQILDKVVEKIGNEDFMIDRDFMFTQAYRQTSDKYEAWASMFGVEAGEWEDAVEHSEEHTLTVPPEQYWQYYQHLEIVDDGLPAGFATESRKTEPYCTAMIKNGRTGWPYIWPMAQPGPLGEDAPEYPAVLTYHEQVENLLEPDPEHPFLVTSGRSPHFHHGTMRHAAFTREIVPAPDVRINPRSAAELGIEHRDWVKLSNDRGEAYGLAFLTEGIAPNVIHMERFWNPECFDDSQASISAGWRECNVNRMARDDVMNESIGSASWRGYFAKVEKAERPPRVWADPKEFQPFMPTLTNEPTTQEVFRNA